MNRREFITVSAVLSGCGLVGLRSGAPIPLLLEPGPARAEIAQPLISLGTSTDHAKLVDTVLEPLGGMGRFVKPGARVVVKPNIGWDRTPELAANTNPEVVRRVVELALAAGAGRVLVFDRTCNDTRRCYTNSGIREAVESLRDKRAKVEFVDKRKFVKLAIANGKSIDSWEFYEPCLKADTFINIPIAKHHSAARLTLCMKNMMGVVGGQRGMLHLNLHPRIVDLNRILHPHLHILDATRILTANGPQGGSRADVRVLNQLGASVDPVALDSWGTTLFGLHGREIEHIVLGHRAGLGEIDLERARIVRV